ncbi:MAG: LysM peptidoglycan-binding domain-containing protein [Gammaproteobacteria bacterium]|nr:MAG: LysM peptidoglycan-binding domain-containing protein [Gammaproteobacteria bacterium]
MLGKFNHHGTFFILLVTCLLAILVAACTTTSESNNADTGIEVGEPNVDIDTSETQALDTSGEPHLEDLPVSPQQHNVEFKASAPEQYTVAPGDTLWDLSNRFLVQPWYWPEIWYLNPQINNPHLIYPGDVISIFYVGGKPYLTVGDGPRVTKLSPKVRSEDIDSQTYGIPIPAIQQFIIRPRVVSEETLDSAPYILSHIEERLAFGTGDRVYARGFGGEPHGQYSIFRKGEELYDPKTDELLGFEAILVGDGEIIRAEDPATLDLTHTTREVLRGDRLLPVDFSEIDTEFIPHAPPENTHGHVISLFDAITQVGTFQVITLSLGERNGIEKGHVLDINQAGRVVADPFEKPGSLIDVELPEESAGRAMVFRTFEKVSYALIMETSRAIQFGDSATNP